MELARYLLTKLLFALAVLLEILLEFIDLELHLLFPSPITYSF